MTRIARFRFRTIGLLAAVALLTVGLFGCRSNWYIRGAKENPSGLWMAALKPFAGDVYYVGSEGDFSYFRVGQVFCDRYKAQTAKIKLPRTFPLGKGKPYVVTEDMVQRY